MPLFPLGTTTTWQAVMAPPWPSFGTGRLRTSIPREQFLALSIVANQSNVQSGTLALSEFNGSGIGIISISTSPGCFDAQILGPNCVSDALPIAALTWTNFSSPTACELRPGHAYYVNLSFGGAEPQPGHPSCTAASCSADLVNLPAE